MRVRAKTFTPKLLDSMNHWITPYKPDKYLVVGSNLYSSKPNGPRPRILENTDIRGHMRNRNLTVAVQDIIAGVARLDTGGNSKPMNTGRLRLLLTYMDKFSSAALMDVLGIGERQARRYMSALVIAQKMIRKEAELTDWNDDELLIEELEQDRLWND